MGQSISSALSSVQHAVQATAPVDGLAVHSNHSALSPQSDWSMFELTLGDSLPKTLSALQTFMNLDIASCTAVQLKDAVAEFGAVLVDIQRGIGGSSFDEGFQLHSSTTGDGERLKQLISIEERLKAFQLEIENRISKLEPNPEAYQSAERSILTMCHAERKLADRAHCESFAAATLDLTVQNILSGEKYCLSLLEDFLRVAYGFQSTGKAVSEKCDERFATWGVDHIPDAVKALLRCRDVAVNASRDAEDVRPVFARAVAAFREQISIERNATSLMGITAALLAETEFPTREKIESIFVGGKLPSMVEEYARGLELEHEKDLDQRMLISAQEQLSDIVSTLRPGFETLRETYAAQTKKEENLVQLEGLCLALENSKNDPRVLANASLTDPDFFSCIIDVATEASSELRDRLSLALGRATNNWSRLRPGSRAAARIASDLFVKVLSIVPLPENSAPIPSISSV